MADEVNEKTSEMGDGCTIQTWYKPRDLGSSIIMQKMRLRCSGILTENFKHRLVTKWSHKLPVMHAGNVFGHRYIHQRNFNPRTRTSKDPFQSPDLRVNSSLLDVCSTVQPDYQHSSSNLNGKPRIYSFQVPVLR